MSQKNMRLPKNLTDDEQNQIIKSLEDFDRSISMKKHTSKCLMAHINEDHTGPRLAGGGCVEEFESDTR